MGASCVPGLPLACPSAPTCPALTGPAKTLMLAPLPDREDWMGRPQGTGTAAAAWVLPHAGPSPLPPRPESDRRGLQVALGQRVLQGAVQGGRSSSAADVRVSSASAYGDSARVSEQRSSAFPLLVTLRGPGTQPVPAALLKPPRGSPGPAQPEPEAPEQRGVQAADGKGQGGGEPLFSKLWCQRFGVGKALLEIKKTGH